jgi:hypothetical protein
MVATSAVGNRPTPLFIFLFLFLSRLRERLGEGVAAAGGKSDIVDASGSLT